VLEQNVGSPSATAPTATAAAAKPANPARAANAPDAADPANATDPADATDPANPTDPADAANPADATDAANPSYAPAMPTVAATPANSGNKVAAAPVPTWPIPTIVIPTVSSTTPIVLNRVDHVEIIKRGSDTRRIAERHGIRAVGCRGHGNQPHGSSHNHDGH